MALNGNEQVARKTRDAVLHKVAEMGYVYNRAAASLSTGVSGLVGLAVHNLTNPYFTDVCAAIEAELELNGRIAMLCNLDESREKQARFLRALVEQKADGLIICPAVGTSAADLSCFSAKAPVVLFAREVEGCQLDFVGNDDERAMALATRHVLQRGHERIGFLCGSTATSVARNRLRGFESAFDSVDVDLDPKLIVETSIYPEGGEEGARWLMALPEPPTAIVCFTDYVALGAVSALHQMGLIPGKDILVMGCDGISEGQRSYINLSTINVQKKLLGQTAARLLQARLEAPDKVIEHIKVEPHPLFRTSSGSKLMQPDRTITGQDHDV